MCTRKKKEIMNSGFLSCLNGAIPNWVDTDHEFQGYLRYSPILRYFEIVLQVS